MKMTPDEKRAKILFSQGKISQRAEKKHIFYQGLYEKSIYNLKKIQVSMHLEPAQERENHIIEEPQMAVNKSVAPSQSI